jgi:hypothetical protein
VFAHEGFHEDHHRSRMKSACAWGLKVEPFRNSSKFLLSGLMLRLDGQCGRVIVAQLSVFWSFFSEKLSNFENFRTKFRARA